LRPGDVITAVNGTSLRELGTDQNGRALAAATLGSVIDGLPDDATLDVAVLRSGSPLSLNAPLQAVYLPALHIELGASAAEAGVSANAAGGPIAAASATSGSEEGCGRISTFDVAPRGEHLYAARILLLDGTTPASGTPSYRVAAGEHKLLVAENIPTQALGIGEIATLRRQTSKPLIVTVKPGTTALVAAQLHLDKSGEINKGGYWDPVVWKEVSEACR
jgi:hypothetical protein